MKPFLGQTPEVEKTDAGIVATITPKQYATILAEKGVTPESIHAMKKARRDIVFAAMEATGNEVLTSGKDVSLVLGGSLTCTTQVKLETRKPGAKGAPPTPVTVYGRFSVQEDRVSKPGDKEFKETHSAIAEKIAKKYSK